MKRCWIGVYGLLLGLALAFPVHAATKEELKKDELKQLRARIESLQKDLASAQDEKSEATDALRESERAISETNRKLYELNGQQHEVNSALASLQGQSKQTEISLRNQQVLLEKLLYQAYIGQQPHYLALLLNGQNPDQLARQLHYYSYISRARDELITKLRNGLERLNTLSAQSKEKSDELKAIQREQVAQKRRLEKEKAEHQKVLTVISKQISKQRREISTLQRNEKRLTRLVEKLAKILSEKKPPARLSNNRLPDASVDSSPFQQLKGKLNLPVKGELVNRFGSPRSDSGLTWKGLFIHSPSGQEVKAIAPAGWYTPTGSAGSVTYSSLTMVPAT